LEEHHTFAAHGCRSHGFNAEDGAYAIIAQRLFRRANMNDASCADEGDLRCEPQGMIEVVQGECDGFTVASERAAEFKGVERVANVEIRGRLIKEDNVCLGRKAARDEHALALAAGEFCHVTPAQMCDISAIHRCCNRRAITLRLALEAT
jgi:hypothetical protein